MRSIAAVILPLVVTCCCSASLVQFDLNSTAGQAGASFVSGNSFTLGGVTVTATVTSTGSTSGAISSSYSANSASGGVNTAGFTASDGDEASEIDTFTAGGETITEVVKFTFTFPSSLNVDLTSLNLQGVGSNSADAANVSLAGSTFQFFTGVADFSGGTDIWTPMGGFSLNSGDMLTVSAVDRISLQGLSLTVVPEPSQYALMGLFALLTCGVKCLSKVSYSKE